MARPDLLVELGRSACDESAAGEAEFDAALDRLLAQAGAEATPEPALRNLVQERLQRTLLVTGAGGASAAASTVNASSSASGVRAIAARGAWARHGSKLLILATGVAIGFMWGRSPSWLTDTLPEAAVALPAPALPSEPAFSPVGSMPERAVAAPATAEKPPPAGEASRAARRATPRAHAAPRAHVAPGARPQPAKTTTENAESLRLVLEQLRKAQLFSRAGEHRRALAALDELDARVPLSVLQDEREVARTLALCDAGQERAATALALQMIQRAPDSAYALSLRESCAGRAELLEQMRDRTSNPVP